MIRKYLRKTFQTEDLLPLMLAMISVQGVVFIAGMAYLIFTAS